jgi:hypothetical protein
MIGDAGSDLSYTGDEGTSSLSVQYYRNKVVEFQTVLDALDQGADAARRALATGALAWEDEQSLASLLGDYESRKFTLRATAEAINAGAAAWNSLGGRMPSLSIPSGLGLAPVIPLALIAAVATAATLIVWGREWLRGVNVRLQQAQALAAIDDPEKRAEVAAAVASAASAAQLAESSPISSIANIAKWGAIAALAFIGWRFYQSMQDR